MTARGQRRATFGRKAFDPHFPHQTLHFLAIDDVPFVSQKVDHLPRASRRTTQMLFIQHPHQQQILFAFRNRIVI